MRILIACLLIGLAGCVHIPDKHYMMPDPPADLMQVPADLNPIVGPNGIDAKSALGVIVSNNTQCLNTSIQLLKLQTWILKTQKNIAAGGNLKNGSR